MSLVGPRPPLPGDVADYDIWHRQRQRLARDHWLVAGRSAR
ncbi:MAG: hypothetical protein Q8L86_13035 [Vicinamibacterales bacterium]|nr:hypothetical protein [Vicinamibacterales bacterium]